MGRRVAETIWQWAGNKGRLARAILQHLPPEPPTASLPQALLNASPLVMLETFCGTANMSLTAVELGIVSRAIVRDKAVGVPRILLGLRNDAAGVIAKAKALAPQVWDRCTVAERQAWFDATRERYRLGTLDAAETLLFYRATFGGIHRHGPNGHNVSSRATDSNPGPKYLLPDDSIELALRAGRLMQGWHIDTGDGFALTPDAPLFKTVSGFDPRRCIVYIDPPFPGGRQGDYNGGPVPEWTRVDALAHAWWCAGATVLVSYPSGPWRFRGRLHRVARLEALSSHDPVIEHLYVWPRRVVKDD